MRALARSLARSLARPRARTEIRPTLVDLISVRRRLPNTNLALFSCCLVAFGLLKLIDHIKNSGVSAGNHQVTSIFPTFEGLTFHATTSVRPLVSRSF